MDYGFLILPFGFFQLSSFKVILHFITFILKSMVFPPIWLVKNSAIDPQIDFAYWGWPEYPKKIHDFQQSVYSFHS